MFVVAETMVAKKILDLVGGEILEGVGPVQYFAWTHIGGRRGRVGEKKENSVLADPSCLRRGLGGRGSRESRGSCFENVNVNSNVIFLIPRIFSLKNF